MDSFPAVRARIRIINPAGFPIKHIRDKMKIGRDEFYPLKSPNSYLLGMLMIEVIAIG